MKPVVVLLAIGLTLGAFVAAAPAASACGWQFTCDTDEWAAEEWAEAKDCIKTGRIDASCAPDLH